MTAALLTALVAVVTSVLAIPIALCRQDQRPPGATVATPATVGGTLQQLLS